MMKHKDRLNARRIKFFNRVINMFLETPRNERTAEDYRSYANACLILRKLENEYNVPLRTFRVG